MTRLSKGVLLLLGLAFIPAAASAFSAPGIKWPRNKLPVAWQMSSGGSADLGETESLNILKRSFQSWTSVCCSYFTAGAGSVTTDRSRSSNDAKVILQWLEQAWPSDLGGQSVLGVTTPVYWTDGEIFDADIVFNGFHHTWDQTGRWPKIDVQSVATHEIGHLLGLNHSQDANATMYYTNQGGVIGRSLEQDDMQGICAIYPKTTPDPNCNVQTQGGRECTLDNDCTAGKKCVNYACVTPATGVTGTACTSGDDCSNGLCVSMGNNGMCTQSCDPNGSNCPTGFACTATLNNGQNICVPGTPSANLPLGSSCSRASDCSSRICVTYNGVGLCSQSCNTTTCPTVGAQLYDCLTTSNGYKVCVPADAPPPPKRMGEACNVDGDCSTGKCIMLSGRNVCTKLCQGWDECPTGYGCESVLPTVRACVAAPVNPSEVDAGNGSTTTPTSTDAGAGPTTTRPPTNNTPSPSGEPESYGEGGGSSGCVVPAAGASVGWLGLGSVALAALIARRRRRD